jgi:hypothetical protein
MKQSNYALGIPSTQHKISMTGELDCEFSAAFSSAITYHSKLEVLPGLLLLTYTHVLLCT